MNPTSQRMIDDCRADMKKIMDWIRDNPTDSKTRYLTLYSAVLASGTLECVFKQIIYDYLSEGAGRDTKSYLSSMIVDSSSNPRTEIISRILNRFDKDKADAFDKEMELNSRDRDLLRSLVLQRNKVAHGKSINVSINDIFKEFKAGIRILGKLEEVLTPPPNA